MAIVIKYFHIELPTLFFALYFVSTYLTFFAVYLICLHLFKKRETAVLSLFFLLFAKKIPGGDLTIYRILDTAVLARPILLFAMYYFLKRNYIVSFICQGIGFLIHPLNAVYIILILGVSVLFDFKNIGIKKLSLCFLALIVLASPSLVWKFLHTPTSLNLWRADSHWVELLRIRSSHHIFPFSWDRSLFFETFLFIAVFFLSWKYKPEARHHRIVYHSTIVIFLLWIIGTVFTEFIPITIVIQLQLFRSSYWLFCLTIIYFSNYFYLQIGSSRNIVDRLLVPLLQFGVLYQARGWVYAFIALLVYFLYVHVIIKWFEAQNPLFLRSRVTVLLLMVIFLSNGALLMRKGISIQNAQETKWLEVQKWARQNTDVKDIFIVPPLLATEGFRIESERTIYGDWKDGTQMFFNPSFGYTWFRRIQSLGYDFNKFEDNGVEKREEMIKKAFINLDDKSFVMIANSITSDKQKAFLVMFRERHILEFPVRYANDRFVVYEIRL
jgi:hypothetical protein